MSTIGLIKIGITVAKKDLSVGLKAAQKDLISFNKNVLGLGQSFSLTGYKSLKLAGQFAAVGLAAGAAAGAGLAALAARQAQLIDANGKLADRLGASLEGLTGLQHAAGLAGVSNELLTSSLSKLQKLLGTGDKGLEEALNSIGLSSQELINLDPVEAFKRISDGLNSIQNPAVKAATQIKIFGKAGQELAPLLATGSDGIAALQREAQLLNLTYSRFDAAQVESANDSVSKLLSIFSGVGNAIAIEFAPAITEATDYIMRLIETSGGIKTLVAPYIEIAKAAMITLADVFDGFIMAATAGFGLLQGAIFLILKPISLLADAIGYITGTDFGAGLRDYTNQIGQNAKDTFNSATSVGVAGNSARQFLLADAQGNPNQRAELNTNLAKDKLTASTKEYIDKLKEEYAQLGLNNDQKKIEELRSQGVEAAQLNEIALIQQQIDAKNKLAENEKKVAEIQKQAAQIGLTEQEKVLAALKENGATAEQLAQAKAAQDQITAIQGEKSTKEDMKKKAESIIEGIKSPAQKYEEQLKEIQKLQEAGLLTDSQAVLAAKQAGGIDQQKAVDKVVSTTSLTAGSAEAFAAIDRARAATSSDPNTDLNKQQLTAQQQLNTMFKTFLEKVVSGDSSSSVALDFA